MSTFGQEEIVNLGDRFKAERDRLGYTQKILAGLLETTEKTLITYETGVTLPKSSVLISFHALGADLMYILVGVHQQIDLEHPSTPAQRLAAAIAALDLSDSDADLILPMAQRLANR